MNDADRWVNLEGEPPPWIGALLDAAREDRKRELTPERAARMKRSFLAALAEQRRTRARATRRRWAGVALGAVLMAAAVGATAAFLLRAGPPQGLPAMAVPARMGPDIPSAPR